MISFLKGIIEVSKNSIETISKITLVKEDVLNKLFENTEFSKNESILIGDTRYDMEGANRIGIDSVGVSWGTGTREEMMNEGALEVFDDYESLIDYLLGE